MCVTVARVVGRSVLQRTADDRRRRALLFVLLTHECSSNLGGFRQPRLRLYNTLCLVQINMSPKIPRCMLELMPRLWSDTIDAHRRDVRQALLDTTAALVAEHG